METAEHREPYESRGSRTDLGAPGGESPPGASTEREEGARPWSDRFTSDTVEKRRRRRGIISRHDGWGAVDDGGAASPSERVVLRIFVGTACAGKAPAAIDRPVC